VPTNSETDWEDRRKHVRVHLAADYDVSVEVVDGAVYSRVQVVDLSLGGVGILIEPPIDTYDLDAQVELRIATPDAEPMRVTALVRHRARGICGVAFQNLKEPALDALHRAIAELLERGNLA
jgi:c-di-GMP-binding flagellar brake protein YcgR